MRNLFDRKFGSEFIKSVPLCPGVYEMLDGAGNTIYVGKAKILRRRLQQYRNARRCKKHHKMREILKNAHTLRLSPCASDLESLLLENRMIQQLRPRFNISGAFSFLYPLIGLKRQGLELSLCYTTTPTSFEMFEFYGAFRSRHLTRDGYFALLEILEFIGHREPARKTTRYPRVKFSHTAIFRQVPDQYVGLLEVFLRGESKAFLEQAVMLMLEKPMARKRAAEVQELIDQMMRFFKFEARPLRHAMKNLGIEGRLIAQEERDRVFLNSRHQPSQKAKASELSAGRPS